MQKTSNYNLNQWEVGDRITRADFNADNAAIDAALGTIPKIAFGIYTGDGSVTRKIWLGYTPKIVVLCNSYGAQYHGGDIFGGIAGDNYPCRIGVYSAIQIVSDGFQVAYNTAEHLATNSASQSYYYIAIR